jgi:hypothetical protein
VGMASELSAYVVYAGVPTRTESDRLAVGIQAAPVKGAVRKAVFDSKILPLPANETMELRYDGF